MPNVRFRKLGEMNLLGYILYGIIERNLQTERGRRAFKKTKGTIGLAASGMRVTLDFQGEQLQLEVGQAGPVDARVEGTIDTLMRISLGGNFVVPVLRGRLRVGGKIWRLLSLIQLLKVEGAA